MYIEGELNILNGMHMKANGKPLFIKIHTANYFLTVSVEHNNLIKVSV